MRNFRVLATALIGTATATPTVHNLTPRQTTAGALPIVTVRGNGEKSSGCIFHTHHQLHTR